MVKSEKKLDEFATKIDKEVLSMVEPNGETNEDEKPIETKPVESTFSSSSTESSTDQKSDWKAKISGIFKIKKNADGDATTATQTQVPISAPMGGAMGDALAKSVQEENPLSAPKSQADE